MTNLPERPPTTHRAAPRNQRTDTRQVIGTMAVVLAAAVVVGALIDLLTS